MALILIRADDLPKLLNTLADIERHAKLRILGKPKILDSKHADKLVEKVLKTNLRMRCRRAAIIKVEEDVTKSIVNIRKIHPPAHVAVISDEYRDFEEIKDTFTKLPVLKGYYSHK
jgi:uncharacterized protein